MEKDDKGSTMIRMGVSGWKFLLVPAYPGCSESKAVKRSSLLLLSICNGPWHPLYSTYVLDSPHVQPLSRSSLVFKVNNNLNIKVADMACLIALYFGNKWSTACHYRIAPYSISLSDLRCQLGLLQVVPHAISPYRVSLHSSTAADARSVCGF